MQLLTFLFSINGRATRTDYWLKFTLPYMLGYIAIMFIEVGILSSSETGGWPVFSLIWLLGGIWPAWALAIRRAHDRGRPGYFVLLYFVPIISLWPMIELGFLRGTEGENEYGDDPRSKRS